MILKSDIFKKRYTVYIEFIENCRKKGKTWDEIYLACQKDQKSLEARLKQFADDYFLDPITVEEWQTIVNCKKEICENISYGFIGDPQIDDFKRVPPEGSCWDSYRNKLLREKFSIVDIDSIQRNSQKIVTYLSPQTSQQNPIRGMVVGNVQSGKTANMSGVISMAADYGFNFFIVLTGTIENLRVQNRKRLISNLNETSSLQFNLIDNPSPRIATPNRLQDLYLDSNHNKRYLTVCLKNSTRLKNLLNWLNSDETAKTKLKVVLIDDEADQASINGADLSKESVEEQTTISRLIKNIVFGRDSNDNVRAPYCAMNYIGYTATPYANLLNEADEDSLYPKNFICLLSPSIKYFGPQQFFGVATVNDGLNIKNEISFEDGAYLNDNVIQYVPETLKTSILWFICTIAIFRLWKLSKPVSMLIHTSQKVEKHFELSEAIKKLLSSNIDIKDIENVYNEQISMITKDRFLDEIPNYGEIQDYPKFDEIKDEILKIIHVGPRIISLSDEDNCTPQYDNTGIHICVDNCKNNIEHGFGMRIVYPDSRDPINEKCPAFIVIGGTTLSRGLTLLGLTTSYFIRQSTIQADTLMQMGRWFGFRIGYELLQRIWLQSAAEEQFIKLTELDYDLRNELQSMEIKGLSPSEYAPRLDTFPEYNRLIVTARNKSQNAIEAESSYFNKSAQTTWFYRDDNALLHNFDVTLKFLNSLGKIDKQKIKSLSNPLTDESTLMWFDIDYNKIIDFLSNLKIPGPQAAKFDDYSLLRKWFDIESKKGNMKNWTVIAGGVKTKINNDVKLSSNQIIHLENRSAYQFLTGGKVKDYNKIIDLKTITQPNDRLMDIDFSSKTSQQIEELLSNKLNFASKRAKYASRTNPLLIVYIIDKNSGRGEEEHTIENCIRLPIDKLNLKNHIVGYYLYIPFGEGEIKNSIHVKLDFKKEKEDEI